MRTLRDLLTWCVGLVVIAFCTGADAQTFPQPTAAQTWTKSRTIGPETDYCGYLSGGIGTDVCRNVYDSYGWSPAGSPSGVGSPTMTACSAPSGGGTAVVTCTASTSGPYTPDNATCTGGTCTCNSGYTVNGTNNGCIAITPEMTCAQLVAELNASGAGVQVASATPSLSFCAGTCTVQGTAAFQGYGGASSFTHGPYTAGPTACSGLPAAGATPTPSPCPVGQVPGTVNGQQVCVQSGTSTQSGGTSGTNGSGGSTGTTSSQTTCTGAQCTTTTTTRDGSGNVTGTTTSNAPRGSFCQENPDASICQPSAFSGACSASFACSGDAIQCAIAKEQHLRNCTLFDSTHADVTAGLGLIDREGGLLTAGDGTPGAPLEVDVGSMMNGSMVNDYGGGCPGDVVYSTHFGVITIPLSGACPALTLAGQIAVAATLLSCALWLVKGSN